MLCCGNQSPEHFGARVMVVQTEFFLSWSLDYIIMVPSQFKSPSPRLFTSNLVYWSPVLHEIYGPLICNKLEVNTQLVFSPIADSFDNYTGFFSHRWLCFLLVVRCVRRISRGNYFIPVRQLWRCPTRVSTAREWCFMIAISPL